MIFKTLRSKIWGALQHYPESSESTTFPTSCELNPFKVCMDRQQRRASSLEEVYKPRGGSRYLPKEKLRRLWILGSRGLWNNSLGVDDLHFISRISHHIYLCTAIALLDLFIQLDSSNFTPHSVVILIIITSSFIFPMLNFRSHFPFMGKAVKVLPTLPLLLKK